MDTRHIRESVAHRPWPMPRVPWVLFQSWQNLLFAHWRVAPGQLRPLVPSALELDLHDGHAWVAIAPFMIRAFRARGLPMVPGLSEFPEMNLRTYVRAGGKAGVYFFSLDAGSRVATVLGRIGYRLPYRSALMQVEEIGGGVRFRSEREDGRARFSASYEPTDHAFEAEPGSLEHFLIERYALFTALRDGSVLIAEIHHRPWPLQPARAEIRENRLAEAEGVPLPGDAPLLHFSRRQDTLIWPPMRLDVPGPA